MKKFSCALVAVLFSAVSGFGAVTVDGTLKWNGASSGGSWDEPSNWVKTAGAAELTVSDLLATSCRYDLSGLADGATVNNGTVNRKVGAIDFNTSNVGTVTLTGKDLLLWGAPEITVASGNTLVYKIGHAVWQTTDGSGHIILLGKGTVRLEPESALWFYNRQIQPCNSVTMVIASTNCKFVNTCFVQWNNSTVKLECDVTVGHFATIESGCSLDLNGHVLKIGASENAYADENYRQYKGPIRGTAGSRIEWSGGEKYTVSGNVTASGKFVVYDGWVTLPATLPDDLMLSVQGNGRFIFPNSAAVGGIEGVASAGGICLPAGKTLTLTKAQNGVFGGVITGAVGLVVNAGTLTLDDRISSRGLLGHWKFENAAALNADSGLRNRTLTESRAGAKAQGAAQAADGVFGAALNFPDASGSDYHLSTAISVGSGKLGTGTGPVTVDFWLRPDNTSGSQYVVTFGQWGDYKQIGVWLDSSAKNLVVCCLNWSFADTANSPVYNWPGLYDGKWHHVAVTCENRALKVYADGTQVKSTTLSNDLNISGGNLNLGSHDESNLRYRYLGSLDEVRVWNRVLSAAEVATAAQGLLPASAELRTGAQALPAPVCHWAFDDAADPGKDSQGAAALVNNDSTAPVIENRAGNHGKSLRRGSSMKLPAASFPASFPTGSSPFTFSARVMAYGGVNENSNWLTWGTTSDTAKSFRLWVGTGSPRSLYVNCGYQWGATGRTLSSAQTECAWRHIVTTYDGSTVKNYCDGVLTSSYSGYSVNIDKADLMVGVSKQCQVDDVQIFNVALTAAEVGVLTRSLGQASAPAVFPPAASLQIASGATVTASNGYFEATELAGAGTVGLANGAQLRVADASAFTGTLSGSGVAALQTAPQDATVSCDISVDGAWSIADVTKAGVQTSGRVFVPTNGVLTVLNPNPDAAVDCVLAKGDQGVQAAGGVGGWTSSLAVDKWRAAFSLSDDGQRFMARVKPRWGLILVVK